MFITPETDSSVVTSICSGSKGCGTESQKDNSSSDEEAPPAKRSCGGGVRGQGTKGKGAQRRGRRQGRRRAESRWGKAEGHGTRQRVTERGRGNDEVAKKLAERHESTTRYVCVFPLSGGTLRLLI